MKNETYESNQYHSEILQIVESGKSVYAGICAGYVIGIFKTDEEAKNDPRTESVKIWGEKEYKKHNAKF